MPRRATKEEFIEKARKIHGSKYDYSEVEYQGNKVHVKINCPEHGPFWQRPDSHAARGQGCPFCALEKSKSPCHGIGINDIICDRNSPAYLHWVGILKRCYPNLADKRAGRYKGYEDCEVCEEWKLFSNFKYWFDNNYIKGYHIDKDILFPGNRVYSPFTCIFVPPRINELFTRDHQKSYGRCCKGVIYDEKKRKYTAQLSRSDRTSRHIGSYDTEDEAFVAYKNAKETYIKEIADEYYSKDLISELLYKAMYNYKIIK